MPWTKRQPISWPNVPARPQAQTASANASMDPAMSLRAPQRPASQVLTGMASVRPSM